MSSSTNQKDNYKILARDAKILNSVAGITDMLRFENINYPRTLRYVKARRDLKKLQIDLLKMQRWVGEKGYRLAIVFEGRDLAGKGGCIRWFIEHLNPRSYRSVALPKPSDVERGQWYFQRYIKQLPNPGEIVFFDRSWYNRAVVEPVNGFCTKDQYKLFMNQVPEFELMLNQDGIHVIKIWVSIDKKEQAKRLDAIKDNPLDSWKLSGLDKKALSLWKDYSRYKKKMMETTNLPFSPWIILNANYAPEARVEAIKHVLSKVPYPKDKAAGNLLKPKKNLISPFMD
jgi:polyphosphate kinase 2